MTELILTDTRPLPASIEILPKQIATSDELARLMPRGARVYLTDIGSAGAETEMLTAARRLRDAGLVPVPHLAARRISSHGALKTRIGRLAEEAGVTDVLVIAGGVNPPLGPFSSSMDLLDTGLLDQFGIKDLAIAGHPEGSPDFPEAAAFEALQLKRQFAERTDARLRIVTQFGFDHEKALAWASGLKRVAAGVPIHIGVAGPAKITTLIKYGTLCGIGNSLSLLTKRAGGLLTLAAGYSPDDFVKPIENYQTKTNEPIISHIHVFPFGGLEKASAWLRRRGSW